MSSISASGKIVTINTTHEKHGVIKLAPLKRFPEGKWYKPERVRTYRNSFLSRETAQNGYGLDFIINNKSIDLEKLTIQSNSNSLSSNTTSQDISLDLSVFTAPNANLLIQKYTLDNLTDKQIQIEASLKGLWGIIRASYAQITENGPIPFPETSNEYQKSNDHTFIIKENGTQSYLKVSLISSQKLDWNLIDQVADSNVPITISNKSHLILEAKSNATIYVCYAISDSLDELLDGELSPTSIEALRQANNHFWEKFQIPINNDKWQFIISRNFAYTFGCCCLKKNGAMITDHQSLPLTWNRDNYFMFKLLETIYKINPQQEIKDAMLGHIQWLFTYITANGWGRSHVINGRIKDKVFQFDQQCYPILEVYDLLKTCPELLEAIQPYFPKLDQLCDILLKEKGDDVFLFKTEENPADDPVLYPYHFSTQILAWHSFHCLDELNRLQAFSDKDYGKMAEKIKADVMRYMITEHEGKKLFCYTTDLSNHELYHDANDLPSALASYWGFISADDPIFKNTLDWAFSNQNRGFYPGKFGGLGSDHAKGHWPLGTAQLLAISLMSNKSDDQLWDKTIKLLEQTVQEDGLYSESVKPESGMVHTRYWFAWPGATIGWLYLLKKFNLS